MPPVDFIDRENELRELNSLLESRHGQLIMVYGRRRVGKTALLLQWARQAREHGWSYLYWMPSRGTADDAIQDFTQSLWEWDAEDYTLDFSEIPHYPSWRMPLRQLNESIGDQPTIVIFDEFPYAVEADTSLPSHLQWAWDHLFQNKHVIFVLSGSHISMMLEQREYDRPLYGRFTGQLELKPMPYRVLSEFFPDWSPIERVSTYAVVGGIPAYLRRFDQPTLNENLRRHVFRPMGLFQNEPILLIGDLVRNTGNYISTLRAIANSNYSYTDIASFTGMSSSQIAPYLKQLTEMRFIERITPATMDPDQRRTTTRARYELRDPFLRFYYRFIWPYLELIEEEQPDLIWKRIRDQFRSFVGTHTFEELARKWVWARADTDDVPFLPETVGQHWSPSEQIDVVAVNWREKYVLLGECKWGEGKVGRKVIRDLVQKSTRVVPDSSWTVHYAFFGRNDFTPAAQQEAGRVGAALIPLHRLDQDLQYTSD